jgi:peptidoglycan/LPS O-acetylase OafA/YrhL
MTSPTKLSPLPNPRSPRYAALDFWRGLACLFVVVLHSAHYAYAGYATADPAGRVILLAISKMGIGVPMFFVISGYCIAATCDSARRKEYSPSGYFYRRFRRILPPYWAAMFLCGGLAILLTSIGVPELVGGEYGNIPHPQTLSWSQWAGNISLTETWRFHFFGDHENKLVGPAWTLCYEEQFYAVCGALLLCPRWFFAGAAGVSTLVAGTVIAEFWSGQPFSQGLFIDGRWLLFAEGILVYGLLNYARPASRGVWLLAGILVLAAAIRWSCPLVRNDAHWRDRAFELVASTSFALGLIVLHPWDKALATTRLLSPITICGRMCYSLYLIHWPVVVILTNAFYLGGVKSVWGTLLLTLPICLMVSLAASWTFHVLIERRCLVSPQR